MNYIQDYLYQIIATAIFLYVTCSSTPPNAIAYSTGKVSQRDMIKAGFVLNILCIIFISVVAYYFWR